MTDETELLEMLNSSRASARYDACEELRVAPSLSDAEVQALEKARNDPDHLVRDAAKEALSTHKMPTDFSPIETEIEMPVCANCLKPLLEEQAITFTGKDNTRITLCVDCASTTKNEQESQTKNQAFRSYWKSIGCLFSFPLYITLFIYLTWKHLRLTNDIMPSRGGPYYDGEDRFCFSAFIPTIILGTLFYIAANTLFESKSPWVRRILNNQNNPLLMQTVFGILILIPPILLWFVLDWLFNWIVGPVEYLPFNVKNLISQNLVYLIILLLLIVLSNIRSKRKS
jgi:hypothetical protein